MAEQEKEKRTAGTAGMDRQEEIARGKSSEASGKPSQAEGDRETVEEDLREKQPRQPDKQ